MLSRLTKCSILSIKKKINRLLVYFFLRFIIFQCFLSFAQADTYILEFLYWMVKKGMIEICIKRYNHLI